MTMRTERLLISRRGFLQTLSLAASAGLIQACAPTAPAPSTPAASKPAAATPAAQPTTEAKPAGQPTAPPAGAQPTAATKPAQQAPAAAKQGGTLVAGWDSDPGALDNNVDRGAVTRTLLHMVYDRLVERDISVKADFPPFAPGLIPSTGPFLADGTTIKPGTATGEATNRNVVL